jgi:hypothetical protein
MKRSVWPGLALSFALVGGQSAYATDYWDLAGEQDQGTSSDNEVYHGTFQQHDLQANAGPTADEDWYRVYAYPQSSYEAIVESTSGDLDMFNLTNFERLDGSGASVLQTSEYANFGAPVGGYSTALRWEQFGTVIDTQFLRVRGGCTTSCGPEDQYHFRFYDTTIAIPRFNNFGSQITVLLGHNPMGWTRNISGTIYFWDGGGGAYRQRSVHHRPEGIPGLEHRERGARRGRDGHRRPRRWLRKPRHENGRVGAVHRLQLRHPWPVQAALVDGTVHGRAPAARSSAGARSLRTGTTNVVLDRTSDA